MTPVENLAVSEVYLIYLQYSLYKEIIYYNIFKLKTNDNNYTND